jgi:hypothetical protein
LGPRDKDHAGPDAQPQAGGGGGCFYWRWSLPCSSAKINNITSSSSSLRVSSRIMHTPLAPQVAPPVQEGIVAVNNVGRDDANINLSITCEHLERLCKASVASRLTSLIRKALSRSGGGVHDINAVEVCGGGSRGPMIHKQHVQDQQLVAGKTAGGQGADARSGSADDAEG